jgi:hypothetical protein
MAFELNDGFYSGKGAFADTIFYLKGCITGFANSTLKVAIRFVFC